jgi:hypothetical protein
MECWMDPAAIAVSSCDQPGLGGVLLVGNILLISENGKRAGIEKRAGRSPQLPGVK